MRTTMYFKTSVGAILNLDLGVYLTNSYNNLKEPFNKHQINNYNTLQLVTRFIPA